MQKEENIKASQRLLTKDGNNDKTNNCLKSEQRDKRRKNKKGNKLRVFFVSYQSCTKRKLFFY